MKYLDIDLPATATTVAGTVTLLNGVVQGTDFTQRIGRKFNMKSLLLRLNCYPNSATNCPVGDIVRVLVVYDCQTNSAAPVVGDILEFVSFESPMNLNNRDRFKVIMDKTFNMNPNSYTAGALTTGAPVTRSVKKFKKLGLEVINSGTGATVGSIQTGGLFLVTLGLVNNGSNINWYSRMRFTDD